MARTIENISLKVTGMTCGHCEKAVERALGAVPGVLSARADQAAGKVALSREIGTASEAELGRAVEAAGYGLAGLSQAPASGRGWREAGAVAAIVAAVAALMLAVQALGGFNLLPEVDSGVALGMVFVIGLLTSLHCVAMCGGIVLSQHLGPVEPRKEGLARQLPGIAYHAGRVLGYTVIGGLVGALGAVFSLGPSGKAAVSAVAGALMLVFGLRMAGLLPVLNRLRLPSLLPSGLTAKLRGRGPFAVGLLNGLIPCGPLQTMQLYALGTGSALTGALSMLVFSVGTVPLLYVFGAVGTLVPRNWQRRMVKAGAVLVAGFGLVMVGRAADFAGAGPALRSAMAGFMAPAVSATAQVPSPASIPAVPAVGAGPTGGSAASGGAASGGSAAGQPAFAPRADGVVEAQMVDGRQLVVVDLKPGYYAPIQVKKGIPVRWVIKATPRTLNGCNRALVVPDLNLEKRLAIGDNVIEFTAPQKGEIGFTCWMGMISSSITVVD